jgi:ParB family chromosome partitioning protein
VPETKSDTKSSKGKGGLGKGLGSLIASTNVELGKNVDFVEIPIKEVQANPHQPRTDFSEEKLAELTKSIEKDGLLQPILVRPEGNGYQIIAGERRWQACKRLGFKFIPAKVVIANDVDAQEISLVENLQRADLNAIEEARGYQRLMSLSGCKQRELAEAVSKNAATISNALRLLDLPEEVQDMMFDGLLSAGHGRAILSISAGEGQADDDARIRLAKKIVDEKLSVREAETLARLYGSQGAERSRRLPSPRTFKIVARKLRQQLATNVRVKTVRGKNRIEIEFRDEDDLERIFLAIAEQKAPGAATGQSEANVKATEYSGATKSGEALA